MQFLVSNATGLPPYFSRAPLRFYIAAKWDGVGRSGISGKKGHHEGRGQCITDLAVRAAFGRQRVRLPEDAWVKHMSHPRPRSAAFTRRRRCTAGGYRSRQPCCDHGSLCRPTRGRTLCFETHPSASRALFARALRRLGIAHPGQRHGLSGPSYVLPSCKGQFFIPFVSPFSISCLAACAKTGLPRREKHACRL